MLFKVDIDKRIILDKDAIKLCPVMESLDNNQLLYICLAYDYFSPFHQWPEEERKRKAKKMVFGQDNDHNPEESKLMQESIIKYRALQYDPRRETVSTYKNKVQYLNEQIISETDPKVIKDITMANEKLLGYINNIQKEIDSGIDESKIEGKGRLSWLEKNYHAYLKVKRNK